MFQMLKKQKEVCKVQWVVIGGVSTENNFQNLGTNLGFVRHSILMRSIAKFQRQGPLQKENCVPGISWKSGS